MNYDARDFPIQENPTITRVSRQVLSGLGNPVLTQRASLQSEASGALASLNHASEPRFLPSQLLNLS